MTHKVPLYWEWIESEAALVKTDGCTKVTGAFRRCCLQHDLAYRFAADPVDAYTRYISGDPAYWFNAATITRAEADASMRRCIQSQSRAGFWSPVALVRWLGLKIGGGAAWDAHRQREREGQAA